MKQIIKYSALLFALILSASIIGGCLTAGVMLVQTIVDTTEGIVAENGRSDLWYRNENGDVVFLGLHFGSSSGEVKSGTEQFIGADIDSLDIAVGSCELVVETWDNNFISVDYENIPVEYRIYEEKGTLKINKTDSINFVWNISFAEKQKIQVFVPASVTFKEVNVDKGSGSGKIIGLNAIDIRVDNGSGGVGISNVTAEKSVFNSGSGSFIVQDCNLGDTSMDGGSGFINLENVSARNLVLDTGSGRADFSGTLTGNSVFESGSGSLNVVIYGKEEDYNLRADMGSGSFYLNGKKENDRHIQYADASNLLVFDAGSGRVSVDFQIPSGEMSEAEESYDR